MIAPTQSDAIVPTLRVGMPQWTLRVPAARDAERPGLHSHAEHGNDQWGLVSGFGVVVTTGC
ncbi:hypothetical protein CFN16_01430 [Pseudomonas fluorescens]|uniref:Uncharacterized protein n=1 Tax=Pseudomonas fluorescens TaxID=294 RepID=A0A345V5L7_PSEFL|nr:hypothetical protein CFN16_01430 [Pseudomonas fluorescens]